MKRILIITALLASIAYGSAYDKIVTYVETEGLTLQQVSDMTFYGLAVASGCTKLDIRGIKKAKKRVKDWYRRNLRETRIRQLQTAFRNIPLCGDAVIIDIDSETNIVMVYIDGVPE